MLTGGCLCGQVRYEADGAPFHATVCHCINCRGATAAPSVAWFSVMSPALRFLAGEPRHYSSSPGVRRSFCPNCGTPLTFQRTDLTDEIDVTTCSLDDPEKVPPRDHVRTRSKLSWVRVDDGLPAFPETRSGGRPD